MNGGSDVSSGLGHFFNARSLAIIGASSDPRKLGGRAVAQNIDLGYAGDLYLVNPGGGLIQGRESVTSIDDLPEGIDCALIVLPAKHVEAAIEACIVKRVSLLIVLSSGFAEYSPQGRVAQERMAARVRAAGLRMVGPNSMGGLSIRNRMSATFTSIADHQGRSWPQLGHVSIASQSGFVGSHLMAVLRDRGVGLAHWIATGNQADVDLSDCIAWLAQDEETRVIAVYLEGIERAQAFRDALELARAYGKPVVMLKAGTTAAGEKAVASHTASLVGGNDAFEAIFRHHGVFTAASIEELVDLVAALDTGRRPGAKTLGVATVSGGLGILIADESARNGWTLPELSAESQKALKAGRDLTTALNPVDIGNLDQMDDAARILLDQGFGATLLAIGHFGLIAKPTTQLRAHLAAHRAAHPDQFIGLVASLSFEEKDELQRLGVFTCEEPTRAVRMIARLQAQAAAVQRSAEALPDVPAIDAALLRGPDDEIKARRLLRAAGLDVAEEVLVTSAQAAVEAAQRLGCAVALKAASEDVPHKTEVGGVLLNLSCASEVEAGFATITANIARNAPQARMDGVLVSPMVQGGVEMIVGVVNDAVFGPLVMVGFGGIFVEALRDTAIRIAPFGQDTALEMLHELRGFSLLNGARGSRPADLAALAQAIARVSVLAFRHGHEIASLEINPLLALPDRAVALDGLIVSK